MRPTKIGLNAVIKMGEGYKIPPYLTTSKSDHISPTFV